jgi:hypothetical protein
MPTIEERVAYLEGRLGDHFAAVDDLRSTSREFRADSNRQFGELRHSIDVLRTDMTHGFDEARSQVETLRADTVRQFGEVRNNIDVLRTDMARGFDEARSQTETLRADNAREFAGVRSELTQEVRRLDGKIDAQLRWLVGLQVTTSLALGSAIVGLYFK